MYKNCSECQKQFLYTQDHVLPRFELGIFMYWTCNSMNNLSSYCGLVDAKIRAFDKDLPVKVLFVQTIYSLYILAQCAWRWVCTHCYTFKIEQFRTSYSERQDIFLLTYFFRILFNNQFTYLHRVQCTH